MRLDMRLEPRERERWARAAEREGFRTLSDFVRDCCNARSASTRVCLSSDFDGWNTPREVLEAIAPLGPIALDPCSNATSIVPAALAWTEADDGLSRSWLDAAIEVFTQHSTGSRYVPGVPMTYVDGDTVRRTKPLIFVNPPYGREIETWIERCVAELVASEAYCQLEIIALVPARTETKWFERMTERADVALWRGRLTFGGASGPATFPSAIAYWGERRELFRRALAPHCVHFLERRS